MEEVSLKGPDGELITVGMVSDSMTVQKTRRSVITVPVYDQRFIGYFAKLVMDQPKHKFDCILLYTGKRRTGKTTLACRLAMAIDPQFSVDGVAFEIEDFNKRLSENPVSDPDKGIYSQAILDEAGFDLFAQNWQDRVQRNFVKKFEVIGVKRQIVHMVLPHRKKLNKSIREEMVEYWVNISTLQKERGLAVLRQSVPNEWEEEVFWKPLAAFMFDPLDFHPFWASYIGKKMAFVDKAAADPGIPDASDTKPQIARDRAIALVSKETHMLNSLIAAKIGVSPQTVGRALSKYGSRGMDQV